MLCPKWSLESNCLQMALSIPFSLPSILYCYVNSCYTALCTGSAQMHPLLVYPFYCWDKVSRCSPGWPGTHSLHIDLFSPKLTKTCLPVS
ncbi:rCG24819 [Rattus norvegicus]|uniref:RCG24819 n=1 Tax=Rattus norvegicus TaxID=10116 RepID=A6JC84_RAT|nr:rCG24819 [Rattus norvegicus]